MSNEIVCSLCGTSKDDTKCMIMIDEDRSLYICDQCVELCNKIIEEVAEEERKQELSDDNGKLCTPRELKEHLDKYVIGQEQAKIQLSTAVYNHYKRLEINKNSKNKVNINKSNIIMAGPTGCGKTLLLETIAKKLNVPFAIADATKLTEAGYVGEDVENILTTLLNNADYDIEKAERGIVYIDEIDKIAKKSENPSISRDVSGEGVQQGLLKIIEGTIASVLPDGGRRHPHKEYIKLDTNNILFIVGGSFDGIEDIVKKRIGKSKIGFNSDGINTSKLTKSELYSKIQQDDFSKFGLIRELIGRLPVITTLSELNEDDLLRVLTEPENAITKQYIELFKYDNVKCIFDEDALRLIAKEVIDKKVGARGLRGILEFILQDAMFNLPDMKEKEYVVDKELVMDKLSKYNK